MNHLSVEESEGLHPWSKEGFVDAAGLEQWVGGRLAWQQQQIDTLLAVAGDKTLENTLRAYDNAVATLSAAGSLASLLDSVHPDKEVRDKARELTQAVAEAATALSLNQGVYRALAAIDMASADPATTHYVSQTLLNYRLAGVDKDDATRAHLRALSDKATLLSLTFAKNVQENVNRVELTDAAELDGLPEDYLRNHPPNAEGVITLTTDYPDMQPVMTFARSAELRLRMFRAYNTRAYPANRPLLLDLLAVRQEIATILGFASWADLATANQMMGSAANLKKFIGELELASRAGAEREYAMVLAFARKQQPGLAPVIHVPSTYLGMPDGGFLVPLKADLEELGSGFKYALLHRLIRKIWTHRLRVEGERLAAVLLIPITAVAALERHQPGLLLAGKGQHHLVFLHSALA